MGTKPLLFAFTVLFALKLSETKETYLDSIATRSTKAEGHLRCGTQPLKNAHIRLFRTNTEDLNDVIASGVTDEQGRFVVEGDSSRFQGDQSTIDPYLRIYHKCDDADGKAGYRRVELRYPREFVTLGRVARRAYNIGALNMELVYPKETRQKVVEGLN